MDDNNPYKPPKEYTQSDSFNTHASQNEPHFRTNTTLKICVNLLPLIGMGDAQMLGIACGGLIGYFGMLFAMRKMANTPKKTGSLLASTAFCMAVMGGQGNDIIGVDETTDPPIETILSL